MRNRERRRWLALAAAVVGVLVLGAVTFWPVISGGDLQTSANSAQLTGGFLLAAAVAVSAWFVQVRQKSQQARAVPGPEDVERAAAVLARLMERQWREEAALRSLDDIERTAAAASGAMQ